MMGHSMLDAAQKKERQWFYELIMEAMHGNADACWKLSDYYQKQYEEDVEFMGHLDRAAYWCFQAIQILAPASIATECLNIFTIDLLPEALLYPEKALEGIKLLENLWMQQSSYAAYALAMCYQKGLARKSGVTQTEVWLRCSAEAGCPEAVTRLASISNDVEIRIEQYKQAMMNGLSHARIKYIHASIQNDIDQYLAKMKSIAEDGVPLAMLYMTCLLDEFEEQILYLKRAALYGSRYAKKFFYNEIELIYIQEVIANDQWVNDRFIFDIGRSFELSIWKKLKKIIQQNDTDCDADYDLVLSEMRQILQSNKNEKQQQHLITYIAHVVLFLQPIPDLVNNEKLNLLCKAICSDDAALLKELKKQSITTKLNLIPFSLFVAKEESTSNSDKLSSSNEEQADLLHFEV